MKLNNISFGHYFLIVAAVISIVGVFSYLTAEVVVIPVIVIAIISAVLAIVMAGLSAIRPGLKPVNLTASVCAILLATSLTQSVPSQIDPLAWWVSGLYSLHQVLGFLVFASLSLIAIVLYLITSFINLEK